MATLSQKIAYASSDTAYNTLLSSNVGGIYFAKTYMELDGTTDDYTALYNLINTTINGADAEIWFKNGTCKISSSITIPSNVKLVFLKGGMLSPDSTKVITINGSIEAGLYQIFTGSGSITGSPKVKEIYPEWFGAVGDGVTNDTLAIQNAINFLPLKGGIVQLQSKDYYITNLTFPKSSVCRKIIFKGKGLQATRLYSYATSGNAISAIGTVSDRCWFEMEDFTLDNNGSANVNGIHFEYNQSYSKIQNIYVRQFYDNIKIGTNWVICLENVYSQSALNDGFTYGSGAVLTTINIIGGAFSENANNNIKISGHNNSITNCNIEGGGTYALYARFCYGLTLNGNYYESKSGNLTGLYFESCRGVSLNGLNISTWYDDASTKLINIYDCKGFSIDGFCIEQSGNLRSGYGIYCENSSAITINGAYLQDISIGMYFKTSSATINGLRTSNVTTPISTFDHQYVQLTLLNVTRTMLNSCSLGALNVNTILSWADNEYGVLSCQNTLLSNTTISALPSASVTYRGALVNISNGAGQSDSVYQCLKDASDNYVWYRIPRMLAATTVFYDPISIANGTQITTTVTVTGAVKGDVVLATHESNDGSIIITGTVTSNNTVTIIFANLSGGAIDLANGYLRVRVIKLL